MRQFGLAALFFCVLPAAFSQLPPAATLREAAGYRNLLIGAAADADEFGISPSRLLEPAYAATLSTQYNMLEPENAMKWNPIQPTQTTYNFEPGDELVTFAQANNMKVRGHNLCWGIYNPDWLVNGGFDSPALSQILQSHIDTVMTHYKGQVFAWDVVNEAVSDSATGVGTDLKDSIWYDQPGIGLTGTGYIEQAFRWARAADPNALLFYNDYNIEQTGPKFQAVYNMAQDFVNRGVPINGIGIQMHIDADGLYPNFTSLATVMQMIGALGLQVHITEMDAKIPEELFTDPATLEEQSTTYNNILSVCLQNIACTAFQTWGFTDKYSWIPSATNNQYGAALPFDANYQPKPAFAGLIQAMQDIASPLNANALVNAANYSNTAVAPGEIVTLFGTNLGPPSFTPAAFDTPTHIATNLAGTQVLFDGIPASVLYSVAGQTSVIVPYSVAGQASTNVEFGFDSITSGPVTVPVAPTAPGIFSLDASGTGPGAILNFDAVAGFTLNSAGNPIAAGGTIVAYATGGGLLVTAGQDGELATGAASQSIPVTATIAGRDAPVGYAGSAPGEVDGLMQVNIQVPAGVPSGPQELIITSNGIASQHGLTVAVQ